MGLFCCSVFSTFYELKYFSVPKPISNAKLASKPTTAANMPTIAIYFCLIISVEYAMALGGVLMGKIIANDADKATLISKVGIPP